MKSKKSRHDPSSGPSFTSIWEAVRSGNVERVKMQLSGRSAINLNGVQHGYTPLFLAAHTNKPSIIRLLAKESVNPNIPCHGQSPLAIAAVNGHLECVKELLEMHANPNSADLPLHCAAEAGSAGSVELLLQHGALLDKKDARQNTPLMLALTNGHIRVAEVMLQKALIQGLPSINDRDAANRTVLHKAALLSDGLRLVDLLLHPSLGADINLKDSLLMTPLHLALLSEHRTDIAKRLLKEQAIDVSIYDANKKLPLHIASIEGRHEVIPALVNAAPHLINAKTIYGSTALHLALEHGHDNIALLLIKRNADVKITNDNGHTPLDMVPRDSERRAMLEECYRTFQEGLISTLNDPKFGDLVFHLEGSTRTIYASKIILYARSEYWRKVIMEKEKEMKQSTDSTQDYAAWLEIVINEGSYDVFSAMLYYLYTDNIHFPQLTAMGIKYDDVISADSILTAEKAKKLQQRTNFLTDVLVMAERYGETRLQRLCSQVINSMPYDVSQVTPARRKKVDPSWRQLVSTFSDDMKKVMNKKTYADVIFSVEGKLIYAHKVIICSRNEFFKAMLMGVWAKEKISEEDPILITDTTYEIFYAVIEFCYTGDCPQIGPDTVVDLYQASHQYMILELRKRCENIIEEALGVENAAAIYQLGSIYADKKMEESALQFITQDAETFHLISSTSAFSDLPEQLLISIYSRLLVKVGHFISDTVDKLIHQRNRQGILPLHLACSIPGMMFAVNWLLQNGADPNLLGKDGYPLHIATRVGDIGTVRALLDHPDIQVNIVAPVSSQTALHIACMLEHENIALLLIERNANTQALNKEGLTPFELIPESNETFITSLEEHRKLVKVTLDRVFNDPALADVIVMGGDAKFYCHRAILCARCPLLDQAIEDTERFGSIKLPSGFERKARVLEIEGVQEQTLQAFLRYLYSDEFEIDPDNAYELMGLAMAYSVPRLMTLCELIHDPSGQPPEASTMAVDFLPLFNRPHQADVRFIFDRPPPSHEDGEDEEEDEEEDWRKDMPTPSSDIASSSSSSLHEAEEEDDDRTIVIHAHRAIIAARCPRLMAFLPKLAGEEKSSTAGEPAMIEVDMRGWEVPRKKGTTPKKKKNDHPTDERSSNPYASFFVLLRYLYSGLMLEPPIASSSSSSSSSGQLEHTEAAEASAATATIVVPKEEEAAWRCRLHKDVMRLAEVMEAKPLERQVRPKVEEEKQRLKKAQLLTSAF